MPHRLWTLYFALAGSIACGFTTPACAEVAVLANRTREPLSISILVDGAQPQPITLDVGESRPLFYQRALSVRFQEDMFERTYQLNAKSAYFFTRGEGDEPLRMEQIGFAHNKPAANGAVVRHNPMPPVVTVKLLVDDDEPTHRQVWEANLRRRFAAAAEIVERHSGVQLKVVAIGMWDSDDHQHDFNASMTEFEQEVSPSPAQVAIGFSSQYAAHAGRVHMGGTRGALHPYILLKERARNMLETQRIELLVHELGHFLGATHSPEPQSVMRPLLTNNIQRRAGARIEFDPVNTLLVAMLGDELRNRGVKRLADVSPPTRLRMEEIYAVMAKALPADPAAQQYLQMLALPAMPAAQAPEPAPVATALPVPIPHEAALHDTARALGQLLQIVKAKRPQPAASNSQSAASPWYTGDKLTEFYVRQAALAVVQLEPAEMERVFLLALGLFFDDTGLLHKFPATAGFAARAESQSLSDIRLGILGEPTLRDRRDLAQHFFISAHLAALLGPEAAWGLGVAKELSDADGGTGFSFADLAADRAGIEFARAILDRKVSLEDLSQGFIVSDYLPPLDGLAEGVSLTVLRDQYGDTASPAFQLRMQEIDAAVLALPAYAK